MSSMGMNMSKQEVIEQELWEIITSRGGQLRFDPDDKKDLAEIVLAASFILAKDDEANTVADAKLIDAKNALVAFVNTLQHDSSLGYEGQEIWVDHELFRETRQFLPCPPFCKP